MTAEEESVLDLVIRMAVIIGHCNVLCEMVEPGTEHSKRLVLIRDIAESAAKELAEHQRKNGSIEAKSGINPAFATESRLQPIEDQQRKTWQKPQPQNPMDRINPQRVQM